jgi:hypothetical protein
MKQIVQQLKQEREQVQQQIHALGKAVRRRHSWTRSRWAPSGCCGMSSSESVGTIGSARTERLNLDNLQQARNTPRHRLRRD